MTHYTAVCWDYPPSPATYYNALLSRGASHSRFLRIAYASSRDRLATSPALSLDVPSSRRILSRSSVHPRPHPIPHSLKRQWPKPPHYHASLLRSPLSHRKGRFRAVLSPSKAVDFFRWDLFAGARASCRERDWVRSVDVDACASFLVAECVLKPYETAAGFFGWHGLGLDPTHREAGEALGDDGRCWPRGRRAGRKRRSSFEVDEVAVEEGRAKWTRLAEELVGPPGLALRSVVEDGQSASPLDPAYKGAVDVHMPSTTSSKPEEVRWDPDMDSSPFRLPRAVSASEEKKKSPFSISKPERKPDSPSARWHGPSPHPGLPHVSSHRFLPPPPVYYAAPPVQFSPWFPGGRVASAQGHGYWYGPEALGTPSPMPRDAHLAKSHPPHTRIYAAPVPPTPTRSPRYPTKSSSGRDDPDKETETDHDYDSTTTTTTDSDPSPHTPIGVATTSRCVGALQLHGDNEVGVHIDVEHAAASLSVRLPGPSTPVKLLGRFSMSPSPSLLPDSHRDGCESSVVFPSLNGSFCQGPSAHASNPLSSPGTSAQTTPAGTLTPVSSSSLSTKASSTLPGPGNEEDAKTTRKRSLETSTSDDGAASMPSSTSSRSELRKDSQGFWESVTPVSPSSSSSSLPLSPFEGKMGSRPISAWTGDGTGPGEGESCASPETASPLSTLPAKSRSLSPDPRCTDPTSSKMTFPAPADESFPLSSALNGVSPNPNPTTLLPAFLATAAVKRKKASRTREIVDRLRSSSVDAGKGGVELDSFGWPASPTSSGEQDGKPSKASAGSYAGNHAGGIPSSSSSSSQTSAESGKKDGQDLYLKPSESSSGKNNGATQGVVAGSETPSSNASSKTTTTTNHSIMPFPILSVSHSLSPTSDFTVTRQSGPGGREPTTAKPPNITDVLKTNANATASPNVRGSGPQLVHSTPNGGSSPTARPSLHLHPSPPHLMHPLPALGPPPPIVAVPAYPHPMYVPFPPYHLAPPHQSPSGQGAWVAVYPGRPPHVHPLSAHTHVAPITEASGMRHVSW